MSTGLLETAIAMFDDSLAFNTFTTKQEMFNGLGLTRLEGVDVNQQGAPGSTPFTGQSAERDLPFA